MLKGKKKGILIGVTSLLLVTLILLGLTYAYYRTRIAGNTNTTSVSVTSKKLELTYNDGSNGVIGGTGIEPSDTVYTKTFTVKNTGDDSLEYGVYLINVINTFSRKDDIKYTLTCSSDGASCNGKTSTTFPSGIQQMVTNTIEANKTHTYTFSFTYKDSGEDQSEDMDKELQAKLQIFTADSDGIYNPYEDNTLAYTLISNAMGVSTTNNGNGIAKYASTPLSSPGNSISGTTLQESAVASSTSTLSVDSTRQNYYITYATSYTFNSVSGYTLLSPTVGKYSDIYSSLVGKYIVSNENPFSEVNETRNVTNLVKIYQVTSATANSIVTKEKGTTTTSSVEASLLTAQDDYGTSYYYRGSVANNYVDFNGMCWRIVRIQGDGSIKLIAEDLTKTCSNSNKNYLYSTSVDFDADFTDGNINKISFNNPKTNVSNSFTTVAKNFQTDKLSGVLDKLKAENWCVDTTAYSDKPGTTSITDPYAGSVAYYGAYKRLRGQSTRTPSLQCQGNTYNKFSDSTDMYVGSLTADEVVFAGAQSQVATTHNYLSGNKSWWTLSPWMYYLSESSTTSRNDKVAILDNTGKLKETTISGVSGSGLRPSIVLKNSVSITGGTGIKTDAYKVS